MKRLPSPFLLLFIVIALSCNNNSASKAESSTSDSSGKGSNPADAQANKNGSIDDIVNGYLALKNALVNDQGNEAASAATQMGDALAKVNEAILTEEQRKVFDGVKDDIKEHAEHIGSNASNITHQREHFDMLSVDIIELIKTTGSSKTLYRDFCPMYDNKRGAYWLSETKDIKNPYYGKEMPTCGQVKEEIKSKG